MVVSGVQKLKPGIAVKVRPEAAQNPAAPAAPATAADARNGANAGAQQG